MQAKYMRVPLALLCQFLILQPTFGQPQAARNLRITVVEGEGARNVVQQIAARPLVVRVDDNNGPVAGATVLFQAPQTGPSGEFANDARTLRIVTGPDGLASAGAFHPNDITGPFQIRVSAESQGATAAIAIQQFNSE